MAPIPTQEEVGRILCDVCKVITGLFIYHMTLTTVRELRNVACFVVDDGFDKSLEIGVFWEERLKVGKLGAVVRSLQMTKKKGAYLVAGITEPLGTVDLQVRHTCDRNERSLLT